MHTPRLVSLVALLVPLALSAGCAVSASELDTEDVDQNAETLLFGSVAVPVGTLVLTPVTPAPTVSFQGILNTFKTGRLQSTGQGGGPRYFVASDDHKFRDVEISASVATQAGGLGAIVGRRVTVTGTQYSTRGALIATQISVVANAAPTTAHLISQSYVGNKRWLTIPCRFSDLPNPAPQTPAYFQALMGNSQPGLGNYWSAASNGRLSIDGSTVLDWQDMPLPASFYQSQAPGDRLGLLMSDCIFSADLLVDFQSFDGFTLAFSHNIEDQVVGGQLELPLDGPPKTFGFGVMSPVEYTHQASVARAMGMGMDLTFSGTAAGLLDSPWDVMSRGFALSSAGLSCLSLTPSFGCGAVLPAAEHAALAGWLDPTQVLTVPRNVTRTTDLDFVGHAPLPGHHGLIRIPIDATRYFTVEARDKIAGSYDVGVPRTSLVIHKMDGTPLPLGATPAQQLEAATRLRFVEAPADGVTVWSRAGDRVTMTFTKQATGYRVVVDRQPPPPPPPPPDPEPEDEEPRCICRGPVYKCEQICGDDWGL